MPLEFNQREHHCIYPDTNIYFMSHANIKYKYLFALDQ